MKTDTAQAAPCEAIRVIHRLQKMASDRKDDAEVAALVRDAKNALTEQFRLSLYLVQCNAATLESMPKSWSQTQKDRFADIAKMGMAAILNAGTGPHLNGFQSELHEAAQQAIERSQQALMDLKHGNKGN